MLSVFRMEDGVRRRKERRGEAFSKDPSVGEDKAHKANNASLTPHVDGMIE